MPLKPLSEITGSLFPELPTSSPDSGAPQGVRAFRRAELWREGLTRAWGSWRGKASSEHEAARIDAAFAPTSPDTTGIRIFGMPLNLALALP